MKLLHPKIVAAPEECARSSYLTTAGRVTPPSLLSLELLAPFFGDAKSWRSNYLAFVPDRVANCDQRWKCLRSGGILETEQWLPTIRQSSTGT